MNPVELEERRKKLEERLNKMKATPLVAVRLDILKKVIEDLDSNPELKQIFGEPVSKHTALVWDKANNEILIADANIDSIDHAGELKFLKILREVLDKDWK